MMRPALSRAFAVLIPLLPKVLIGLLVGLFLRFLTAPASEAQHPFPFSDPHKHLLTMTNYEIEAYCVHVIDTSITQADAFNKVRRMLHIDGPAQDWDGQNDQPHDSERAKIFFAPQTPHQCGQVYWEALELRFWVSEVGCGTDDQGVRLSCLDRRRNPTFNPLTGHREYLYMDIKLASEHLLDEDFWRHIVNHETGHALGLRDGTAGDCPPGGSVMHDAYHSGCPDLSWPTAADRDVVQSLIPPGGGGSGGGGRGGSFGFGL